MRRIVGVILLAAPLFASAAHADFESAVLAYKESRFDVALSEFESLASIGHARSQHFLALMHARGEGVPVSADLTYGWMTLAAAHGMPDALAQIQKWAGRASNPQKKLAGEMMDRYGPEAVAARLLPATIDCASQADSGPGKPHLPVPDYPLSASRDGLDGFVLALIHVGADGRAHDVRLAESMPRGRFEDAVYRSAMKGKYQPATRAGQPVPAWGRFAFRFLPGPGEEAYRAMKKRLDTLQGDSSDASAAAAYVTGMVMHYWKDPGIADEVRGRELIEKAARAGRPDAQFIVGRLLSPEERCVPGSQSNRWIHQAAAAGVAVAQLTLVDDLLKDPADRSDAAMFWLERAAASKNPSALRLLGRVLTEGKRQDPGRALSVGQELEDRYAYDPTGYVIRAKAHALRGDFAKAVDVQTRAIKRAKDLGWDLTPLSQALDAYKLGRTGGEITQATPVQQTAAGQ